MSETVVQLACFEVGEACYALPVGAVREIVRLRSIAPLPGAPPLIEGLVDLRGRLIPVVDLASVVGAERRGELSEMRVAVIAYDDLFVGLCVDQATEVLRVPSEACRPLPPIAVGASTRVVESVIRLEGRGPVLVLSMPGIVRAVGESDSLSRSHDAPKGEAA